MARRKIRKRGEENARFWIAVFKWGGILGIIVAVGVSSYLAGRRGVESSFSEMQARIDTLNQQAGQSLARNREIEASLAEAQRETSEYRKRFDAIAPSAELKSLIAQLQKKLGDGVSADRLSLFVGLADKPRGCQPMDKKRFYVRLGTRIASENTVSYPGGITVTAEGVSGSGPLAGAFDPARPVTITFGLGEGKESPVSGLLPLTHHFVQRNVEYFFTLTPNGRGLIEISGERCDLL